MSTEKFHSETPEQVTAILERMARERARQPELSEHEPAELRVPQSTVRTWRHRGSMPFGYVKTFAHYYQLSLDYVYFGLGDARVTTQNETPTSYSETPPPQRYETGQHVPLVGQMPAPEILASTRDGKRYILLPKLASKPSAGNGNGSLLDSIQIIGHMAYEQEWYDSHIGIPYHYVVMMEIDGKSMEPDLFHGEKIVVDLRYSEFRDDAIYVFLHNGDLKIKRVHALMDGSYEIKSSNPVHSPDIVKKDFLDSLEFVGRPRHAFSGRPLL